MVERRCWCGAPVSSCTTHAIGRERHLDLSSPLNHIRFMESCPDPPLGVSGFLDLFISWSLLAGCKMQPLCHYAPSKEKRKLNEIDMVTYILNLYWPFEATLPLEIFRIIYELSSSIQSKAPARVITIWRLDGDIWCFSSKVWCFWRVLHISRSGNCSHHNFSTSHLRLQGTLWLEIGWNNGKISPRHLPYHITKPWEVKLW
jgi:hypothetical protein